MLSIEKYQKEFVEYLEAYSTVKEPLGLYEPIQYILNLGGKRLRPVLTLMTAEILRNTLFQKKMIDQGDETQEKLLSFDIDIKNDLGCIIMDEAHYIKVDESQETNIKGVYAAGDLTTNSQIHSHLTTDATDTLTGSVIVDGGMSIKKQLHIGSDSVISGIGKFINTTDATGLGTGGALTITGGLSVDKHVFIGMGLDMNLTNIKNLATPIDGDDAVNKNYIDAVIVNLPTVIYKLQENNYVNTLLLNNNQSTPADIPLLYESADKTLCFLTYIYINVNYGGNNYTSCLYSIICFYNNATNNWIYKTQFSGSITAVNFVVVSDGINVKIQYTNGDLDNVTTIQYYIDENIVVNPHTTQYNYTLPVTSLGEYHDFLNYLYTDIAAVKLHVFVTTETSAAFYIFDLLFKENAWVLNYERVGPDLGIVFRIRNANSLGTIQYTYTSNNGSGFVARVKQYKILQSFYSLQLQNNAYDAILEQVNVTSEFVQMYIYVEKPTIHEYAYYTIEGFLYNNNWFANSGFIGDTTDVLFSINKDGYLQYRNPDPVHPTYIKIMMILPNIHIPVDVIDGGTGHTYLEPYSVLVGNGYGPILNTTEFIYQDCTLKMKCPEAQIVVYNTTDAVGLGTGGNLTLYGGASVGKSLYVGNNLDVGNSLIVNNINITPSSGDINENIFYANNNQSIPVNIPDFKFDTTIVKSFIAQISITISLTTGMMDSLVVLKGISTHAGWKLMLEFIGDNTGISFSIDNTGQIYYTSSNIVNWISCTLSYKATSYSISGNYIQPAPATSGNFLVTQNLTVQGTTESNSTSNGSIVAAGGIGIGKNVNVGGMITVEKDLVVKGNIYGIPQIAIIEEQLSNGTSSVYSTVGSYVTRVLNTVVSNTVTGLSLNSNQITLLSGTYRLDVLAPGYDCARTKARLRNITDSSTIALGTNGYVGTSTASTYSHINNIFTISSTKVIEVQQYFQLNASNQNGGMATSSGDVEVYARIIITKLL